MKRQVSKWINKTPEYKKKLQEQKTVLGMKEEKQSSNKHAGGLCSNINVGD